MPTRQFLKRSRPRLNAVIEPAIPMVITLAIATLPIMPRAIIKAKDEYQRADRTYNQAWGTLEDYKDGYQQGFEAGYSTGYERGNFNSSIPTGLSRRGTVDSTQDNSIG